MPDQDSKRPDPKAASSGSSNPQESLKVAASLNTDSGKVTVNYTDPQKVVLRGYSGDVDSVGTQLLRGIPGAVSTGSGPFSAASEFTYNTALGNSFNSEVSELRREIAAAKSQLNESQKQIAHMRSQVAKNSSEEQIQELRKQVDSLAQNTKEAEEKLVLAQVRTDALTAPIVMPTPEDMKIQLIPTHWFDKLEEHRSDEAYAFAIASLLAGTILGTIANWFTSEELDISRSLILFLVLIGFLLVFSIFWWIRIRNRSKEARNKIMGFTKAQKPEEKPQKQP